MREGEAVAWDEVTGSPLDPERVRQARQVEMDYFSLVNVYARVPRTHQKETGGKLIPCKWVDVNKGDNERPNYRSRLVGQEIRGEPDHVLYAGTPPLKALRCIISWRRRPLTRTESLYHGVGA